MALAIRRPPASHARPRLRVLYCRPIGDFDVQDGYVARLRREFGARLEVETSCPSEAARRCRTWVSATQPTLLVLRGDEIVAMAVGRLPLSELEQLIPR